MIPTDRILRVMNTRIAAAQVYADPTGTQRSVEKACDLVAEAARLGVQVLAFPETWLPGYPAWLDACRDTALWDHAPVKRAYAHLHGEAIEIPGPETEKLAAAAREHEMVLNMSVHERVRGAAGHGTLFNTMLLFDGDGTLRSRHRKLMPTHTERLVWGQGDGSGLQACETAAGRVGGLICWEHWMPLARQALHESAEQIHVAAWPAVKEMMVVASRHYAFEGRCFVIAAGGLLARENLPPGLEVAAETPDPVLNGGSLIVGPDGQVMAGPVHDEETILHVDVDLARIPEEMMTLDVTGHYARPDVLRLERRGGALEV